MPVAALAWQRSDLSQKKKKEGVGQAELPVALADRGDALVALPPAGFVPEPPASSASRSASGARR